MKYLNWNSEKNEILKRERGITFEEVVLHIVEGGLLDVIPHPNQDTYPGQRVFVVDVGNYACLVPFVEGEEGAFLKTIIPSRKMTRRYLRGGQ